MEAWEVEMSKMFKGEKKQPTVGFVIGTVINPLPEISISLGDDILLDKDDLIIANHLYLKHRHQSNEYNPIAQPLTTGDQVILIPDASGQLYALIDKAGE